MRHILEIQFVLLFFSKSTLIVEIKWS